MSYSLHRRERGREGGNVWHEREGGNRRDGRNGGYRREGRNKRDVRNRRLGEGGMQGSLN